MFILTSEELDVILPTDLLQLNACDWTNKPDSLNLLYCAWKLISHGITNCEMFSTFRARAEHKQMKLYIATGVNKQETAPQGMLKADNSHTRKYSWLLRPSQHIFIFLEMLTKGLLEMWVGKDRVPSTKKCRILMLVDRLSACKKGLWSMKLARQSVTFLAFAMPSSLARGIVDVSRVSSTPVFRKRFRYQDVTQGECNTFRLSWQETNLTLA